ncbi:hypothetical protein DL766_009577 [Monosporascus sp. MC13-8B]|nr:hypothetical protein DL766_009577 [Monosporascus sp. MC13-8B]
MAEALTVVGIVANIIQLVDFGSRVLKRLEEYQSKFGDVPEAFRHIKAELPVLLDALRQTKAAIDAGSMRDESKNALLPAVQRYLGLLGTCKQPRKVPGRFQEGYRKIAERAKLPGWDQFDVDILRLVYSWLSHEENGRWVMIIDNADDLNAFSPSDRDVAFRLTGSYADIIRIPPMEQAHALALVRTKLGGSVDHDDAVALVCWV